MPKLTAIGSMISLMGCLEATDDAVGLRALQPSIADLGREVVRVDDDALTTAFRDHAAIWQAAVGE